jgi:hypothetical protein
MSYQKNSPQHVNDKSHSDSFHKTKLSEIPTMKDKEITRFSSLSQQFELSTSSSTPSSVHSEDNFSDWITASSLIDSRQRSLLHSSMQQNIPFLCIG